MSSEVQTNLSPFGKIKLTIEYDGTDYFGWQRQGQGHLSIQEVIEDVLSKHLDQKIDLMCAGRTDSGVHAMNQIAHFSPPKDMRGYNMPALFASNLPPEIVVKKAELMPAHFHAQKSALSKTYVYRIWNKPVASALRSRYSLWVRQPLNLERLNEACQAILGEHDFRALRSEGSAVNTTVRTIYEAGWVEVGDFIEFRINGSGFLKQMVRNLVGTFLQIEWGHRTLQSLPGLLRSRDRKQAGPTVGPQGLFLEKVFYPPELDKSAQSL